jgi:putative tricarboxylic transport membrane protein
VTLRSDHIAGAFFVALGLLVLMLSGDLPTGRLSMPGAGMLPKLLAGLMAFFGLVLILRAKESAPIAQVSWRDLVHAVPVIAIAGLAVLFYERLGFVVTMSAMVFSLVAAVERRHPVTAALFSIVLTLIVYFAFTKVLKAPLQKGILWFLP